MTANDCEYIAMLAEENARLRTELDQYAGWAPDQFLRYQAEHRRLQESFKELDAKYHAADSRLARVIVAFKAILNEDPLDSDHRKIAKAALKELEG